MAQAPSALAELLASRLVKKMRGLVPTLPSVPPPELKLIVVPALRVRLAKVRSALAKLPTVCTPEMMILAPWATVRAPSTSLLALFARPLKLTVPPLIEIGAASLTRLVLSMTRPALLSNSSVP